MKADPRVGTELAGHRIEAVIGRGGMAVVYLAEHLRLGRKVALKVLSPELVDDEAFRERFIRESRIAAGLDHPNIVTVYDAGETGGVLYISMRYVEGSDLERLLREEGRLEPARAVSIVSQSAAALDAAHAEGLVHRDVKPANILLAGGPAKGDRVYLSDFGITKRILTDAGITRTGQFVGTVDYVAPEQIQGQEVDGRADVYSLGCVLYRCLTGEVPFPREAEVATIYAHLQDDAPAPSERTTELPFAVDEVLSRALAKSRDRRYQTCGELVEDAERAIGSPARTSLETRSKRLEAPPEPLPRADGGRAARRRRAGLVVAGLAVTAAAVAAGLLFLTDEPASVPGGGPGSGAPSTAPPRSVLPKLHWETVPDPIGVFLGPGNQNITRAVTTNGVIVAVGRDAGPGRDAAVWRSSDGTHWVRVQDPSLAAIGEQQMAGATVHGSEVVAVGWERLGDQVDAAVWTSDTAGRRWDRVDDAGLDEPGDQAMRRVVATDDGPVAVGFETTTAANGLDAAVWESEDGHRWSRVLNQYFVGAADQDAFGVTTFEDQLIVVGYQTTENGDRDAAVWVRSGASWSPVGDPASLGGDGDQQMTTVIEAGPRLLVAVGFDTSGGDFDAAVWTSTDGLEWERVLAGEKIFGGAGNQQMFAFVRIDTQTGTVLVAGGVAETPKREEADGAIWLSRDGLEWKRIDTSALAAGALGGLGRQQIKTLVVFGDRLVAAGSSSRTQDDGAAVWIARIPGPAPSP